MVADVEGDVAIGGAQLIEELDAELAGGLGVGESAEAALQGYELPTKGKGGDNLGRFAGSYQLAPWRDDMLLVGTTMHGVLMSARSRHRQAELIAELTGISSRIFCQRQL